MSSANPLWGSPRIVGELAKLGIQVAKATVEKLFELLSAVAPGEDFVFQESPRHHSRAA